MRFDPSQAAEIAKELSLRMERARRPVPIGISNRHLHVCREHWDLLFGPGGGPTLHRQLRQPGFYAAKETVEVQGPKGSLKGVRIIGPLRPRTQVEVSRTDSLALGLQPPVRGSGDLKGASSVRLTGPKGSVEVAEAVILSQRHIHFTPAEAADFKVSDGEFVRARVGGGGPRETVFEGVLARVSDKFALELHLDTDEANAAGIGAGGVAYIV